MIIMKPIDRIFLAREDPFCPSVPIKINLHEIYSE